VPRLCEFYPGICLTTEEKARKNLSQGKKNLSQSAVYILPKTSTHYKTLTNTHITKQYKTTTVQIKTKCILEKQHKGEKEQYLVSNVVNSCLFTYNTSIKILYMFRALPCSSSGGLRRNCIYAASGIVISEEFRLKFYRYQFSHISNAANYNTVILDNSLFTE
jgi:hypothetical protein